MSMNGWNLSILILQCAFTLLVRPSCLDIFIGHFIMTIYNLLKWYAFICITKNIYTNFPECKINDGFLCSKTIMTDRLIKWNLVCFMCLHTAKVMRQVPSWRQMISEQLGENLLLHVIKNAVTSLPYMKKLIIPDWMVWINFWNMH